MMGRKPRTYRTKSGRVLTDADIEALADEAERGYDVEHLYLRNRRKAPGIILLRTRSTGTEFHLEVHYEDEYEYGGYNLDRINDPFLQWPKSHYEIVEDHREEIPEEDPPSEAGTL